MRLYRYSFEGFAKKIVFFKQSDGDEPVLLAKQFNAGPGALDTPDYSPYYVHLNVFNMLNPLVWTKADDVPSQLFNHADVLGNGEYGTWYYTDVPADFMLTLDEALSKSIVETSAESDGIDRVAKYLFLYFLAGLAVTFFLMHK